MPVEPNIALSYQPIQVPDAMASFGRAMQLKNMLQQSKIQDQEFQDQQTLRKLYGESGGDLEQLAKLAAGKVSPNMLTQLNQAALNQRKTLAEIDDKRLSAEKTRADLISNVTEGILNAKPDQRPGLYQAGRAQLIQAGHLKPEDAPEEYPGDEWLTVHSSAKNVLDAEMKRRQAAATEAQAAASKQRADTDSARWNAEQPGVAAEADQKVRENASAQLSAQTTREGYAKVWGDLPARIARAFPAPESWEPKTTAAAVRQAGMTPAQQATAQQATDAAARADAAAAETARHNKVTEAQGAQRIAQGNAASADPAADVPPDANSQSILAQTGLSMPAFYALTGQVTKLPRDRQSRAQAMFEAQKFANKKGVDISTLASQYKTYNDVLSNNISRMNNTKIMESELEGTIDNLKGVVKAQDLSRLRFANVAKIWAGQEVNDDLAQQYAMHLYQLRNELAAYGAATQGRTGNNITLQDIHEAEQTIRNGIAKGSLEGLSKAVTNSTEKMGSVMQRSVDAARKSIWELFGVGKNYRGSTPAASGSGEDLSKVSTDELMRRLTNGGK